MTDIKDDLRQIPLLSHLDEAQIRCIADKGAKVHLPAGTLIAKQGDPPDGFYMILAGKTEWTRKVGQQEAHAMILVAGDVFALIDSAPG